MGNDITISISRNLNEISLSLIKISDLYENNLNSVKMICLLDESLRSQFEEISSIIFIAFKYIVNLENNTFSYKEINYKEIKRKILSSSLVKKKTSYRTLSFLILEIIVLINNSIDDNKISKDFYLNFAQSFYKLYIFEKKYLKSKILKEIIKEIFNIKEYE